MNGKKKIVGVWKSTWYRMCWISCCCGCLLVGLLVVVGGGGGEVAALKQRGGVTTMRDGLLCKKRESDGIQWDAVR